MSAHWHAITRLVSSVRLPVAVGVVLAMVVLASCTSSQSGQGSAASGSPDPSGSSPSSSRSPTPSTSSSPASPTPSGSGATTSAADTRCHTNELALSPGMAQGAAGTIYQAMVLTVTGVRSCDIYGYPGVSFLDGSRVRIGVPAERRTGMTGPSVVHLTPGASASFLVSNTSAGIVDSCAGNPVSGFIQVYPPDETAALTVALSSTVCNPKTGYVQAGTSPSA